jgi:hypothetical protein
VLAGVGTALATGAAMGAGQAIANRAIDAALGPQKYEVVTELRGMIGVVPFISNSLSSFYVVQQILRWTSITLL